MFWSKKDSSKAKNTLLQWILQNIQRIAKFIMVNSYEMNFIKSNFILVKSDEMYNILKCASRSFIFMRWRWN